MNTLFSCRAEETKRTRGKRSIPMMICLLHEMVSLKGTKMGSRRVPMCARHIYGSVGSRPKPS